MSNFIILGASNVTLALPHICKILFKAKTFLDTPSGRNLLAAAGHGRSYCGTSRVIARSLPSILDCGIWEQIENLSRKEHETKSLITDIGNDLLYGFSPNEIIASVTKCIERLLTYCNGTDILVSLPPLQALETMSALRYHCARSILFPFRKHESLSSMMAKVKVINEGLVSLENSLGIRTIMPRPEWYGIDPIHIKRKERLGAWKLMLSFMDQFERIDKIASPSLTESIRVYLQKPERRSLLGIDQRREQPCLNFNDDILLYLF